MSPALDDSLGEEVAMVMISMLAGASVMFSFAAAPAAQHGCTAQAVIAPVSSVPVPQDVPKIDGQLPNLGPKSRDPAVLLPECKDPPRQKQKRRLSDHPMA
jgi:hypothetical protein